MNSVLHYAIDYINAGMSVLPIKLDGSKGPALGSWKHLQTRLATMEELQEWFKLPDVGIGIICGSVSGGLEVVDFDMANLLPPMLSMLDRSLIERLSIYETPGGWHLIYRCSEVCRSSKIAMWEPIHTPSQGKRHGPIGCGKGVRIETRGECGYIVAEGSPCCVHATGLPYCHYMGPTLLTIESITPDERRSIWMAAESFDLSNQRTTATQTACKGMHRCSPIDLETPWDWFDRCGSWEGLLLPLGWHRHGDHWTRPGKSHGVSASVGSNTDGIEVLTCFSTAVGLRQRCYGKFNLLVEILHGGNRADAIRSVREMMGVAK
jgi:hypothetical protein